MKIKVIWVVVSEIITLLGALKSTGSVTRQILNCYLESHAMESMHHEMRMRRIYEVVVDFVLRSTC